MIPVKVFGGAVPSRSKPVSTSTPLNMFMIQADSDRAPIGAYSWPGYKAFADTLGGIDRGMTEFNGVLYKVSGSEFRSIASDGTSTLIGTIDGTKPCYFANNFGVLAIVSDGNGYYYDGTTLSEITDVDLNQPVSVAMLNNYYIYAGQNNDFVVSDFATPESIPTNYVANAESDGDELLRVYVFQERAYMFGTRTIEPWYFTGIGEPPVARETGGVISRGLSARGSIANNHEFVFFLGSDNNAYKLSGYQIMPMLNPQMSKIFEDYTVSDARGYFIRQSGQGFYMLHFPTEEKTWAIQIDTGWAYEISNQATSYLFIYGKHLVAVGEKILEMDSDTYTDDGQSYAREVTLGPITAQSLSGDLIGRRIFIRKLRLAVETGVSLINGEGSDSDIICSISSDGGRTFTEQRQIGLGVLGDYLKDVEYNVLKKGLDFQIKLRVTDPIGFTLHNAYADITLAGY